MTRAATRQEREFKVLLPAGLPEDLYLYDVEGKFLFPVITPNGLAPAAFVYLVKAGQGPGELHTELGHVPGEIVYHGNGWMTVGVEFKLSDTLQQKKDKLESAIHALGVTCQS